MYVFYTVNSGLYFEENRNGIMIDGLHKGKAEGFSDMPFHLQKAITDRRGIFSNLSVLAFTHFHPDHFDGYLLDVFKEKNPNVSIITPSTLQRVKDIYCNGIDICPITTTHIGKCKSIFHNSFLLNGAYDSYFVAGDGLIDEHTAESIAKKSNKPIKAIFLNTFHLINKDTTKFISVIKPGSIFLVHMPFEVDDIYLLRKQTESILKRTRIKAEILFPMSEILT